MKDEAEKSSKPGAGAGFLPLRRFLPFILHPSSFILHPFRPMLTVIDHPLVQVKLGLLRDGATAVPDFRRALRETAALMFFQATADLPTGGGTE